MADRNGIRRVPCRSKRSTNNTLLSSTLAILQGGMLIPAFPRQIERQKAPALHAVFIFRMWKLGNELAIGIPHRAFGLAPPSEEPGSSSSLKSSSDSFSAATRSDAESSFER